MTMNPGRTALRSFYLGVKAADPKLAVLISEDIIQIALFENDEDKTPVQNAINHLRHMTSDLSYAQRRLRDDALTGLGYS